MDQKVFRKISYGVYIVTSREGDRLNGQVANAVMQVCSSPPIVAIAINKENLTHAFIQKSGVFAVSILAQDVPPSLIGRFGFKSGRDLNKFEGVPYRMGGNSDQGAGCGDAHDLCGGGTGGGTAQRRGTDDLRLLSRCKTRDDTQDGTYLYRKEYGNETGTEGGQCHEKIQVLGMWLYL